MDYANYWRDQALKVLQPPGGTPAPAGTAPGGAPAPGAIQPTRPAPLLKDYPAGDGAFDAIKWSEALTTWTAEQVEHRSTVTEQRRAQQATATTVQSTYNAKVATFRTTVPDFDIVAQNPNLPISSAMVEAIQAAELGPQVYYHLAKNPAEAARIHRLPAQQQAAAIGKIEGRIEAGAIKFTPAPGGRAPAGGAPPPPGGGGTPPPRSRAPDPPSGTRSGGAGDVNLANCSLDEYLAQRLPHIARSGGKK